MRFILAWVLLGLGSAAAQADPCSIVDQPYANCFRPRVTPTLKAVLVHYGDHADTYDFAATERMYVQRFNREMRGILNVEIVDRAVIPLKKMERNLDEVRDVVGGHFPDKETIERLERLWFYYAYNADQLIAEIHALLRENGYRAALEAADTVLVISEPQFEALGFMSGAYGFTEQPSEIAWALPDGGTTEWQTPERLVDELLHETGHLIGLDHASARCFSTPPPPGGTYACCMKSPGGKDVMSYCRDRATVKDDFYFGYTACTKRYVKKTTVPALLNGGSRPFQPIACD